MLQRALPKVRALPKCCRGLCQLLSLQINRSTNSRQPRALPEEAIQSTKSTMTALALEFPEISAKEALARATATGNSREDVRGYSPQQHALGRAPDLDGRF